MREIKIVRKSIMCFLLFVNNIAISGGDFNSVCEMLSERAALEQLCYRLEDSISTYKELISICPDDSLSKHQMGISYLLLGKKEIGLNYMYEAIEDAKNSNRLSLADKLKKATKNWEGSLFRIDAQNVESARKEMQLTEECKRINWE